MKQLCILMPVYASPDRVKYTINKLLPPCEKKDIDIYLCDGCGEDTMINMYHEYHSEHLFYMDKRKNPSDKLFEAFEELKLKYQYIWLVGDSQVLLIEDIYSYVFEYIIQEYDIIHFCDNKCNHIEYGEKIIRNNVIEFYKEDAWYLTCYGATILASSFIDGIDWRKNRERYTDSFWYVMTIISKCAYQNYKAIHIQCRYKEDNPKRLANGSVMKGNALQIFGHNWVVANRSLPSIFDKYKEEVTLSLDKNIKLFSINNIFKMSIYGNYTKDKIQKYKEEIPFFTTTPLVFFYFVAIFPKWLIKLYTKVFTGKIRRSIRRYARNILKRIHNYE